MLALLLVAYIEAVVPLGAMNRRFILSSFRNPALEAANDVANYALFPMVWAWSESPSVAWFYETQCDAVNRALDWMQGLDDVNQDY
jgi:hypothetical protein